MASFQLHMLDYLPTLQDGDAWWSSEPEETIEAVEDVVDLPDVSEQTVALAALFDDGATDRSSIAEALSDVESSAMKAAVWHSGRATTFGRLRLGLGIPAAVLAAVAGATGLASTTGRVPAAILALIAAAVAAASTFVDSGSERQYHQDMASEWLKVALKAKAHRDLDLKNGAWVRNRGREAVENLLLRHAELIRGRPALSSQTTAS